MGEEYKRWKIAVYYLDMAEIRLLELYESKKITKRKRNKIKKILNDLWINVWDYYPNKNPSVEKAFKSCFR